MRLYLAAGLSGVAPCMSVEKRRRLADAVERSVTISRRILERADLEIQDSIAALDIEGGLDYDLEALCIAEEAWDRVGQSGIEPRLVFAHPKILKALPASSFYYRNIALLPRKRVSQIAYPVERWEEPESNIRVPEDKALKVSRLYNAVIGSIILNSDSWTMEDSYRNILANMGIGLDGAIRNLIGQAGEAEIRRRMVAWLAERGLLIRKQDAKDSGRRLFDLRHGIQMRFGSEPDIAFIRDGTPAAVVEIKAGKDPAGALERLGAVKKSFDRTPPQCRKFLVAGIVTSEMRRELREMHIDTDLNIDDVLENESEWRRFMNGIFHHALRITGEVK